VQALLDDNIKGGEHTAADLVAKVQAIFSESALLRAMFDVDYFTPNTPPYSTHYHCTSDDNYRAKKGHHWTRTTGWMRDDEVVEHLGHRASICRGERCNCDGGKKALPREIVRRHKKKGPGFIPGLCHFG
jgi:hypothetical protein